MRRYPYTLEMLYEEDAILNDDGSWTEGSSRWVEVSRCNARQNGKAAEVALNDGTVRVYSFEVTMPSAQTAIPNNAKVRIIDSSGVNIIDGISKDKSTSSLTVLSNKLLKQRYEKAKIWL